MPNLFVILVPLATAFAFTALAFRRGLIQRRPVNPAALWLLAFFAQLAVAVPAGCAAVEIARRSNPGDEWHDIYGGIGTLVSIIAAPFVAIVVGGFAHWCERHRVRPGHCRNCDYDLTGNRTGRCPECGHSAPLARDR